MPALALSYPAHSLTVQKAALQWEVFCRFHLALQWSGMQLDSSFDALATTDASTSSAAAVALVFCIAP